jgi:hypothetical protein
MNSDTPRTDAAYKVAFRQGNLAPLKRRSKAIERENAICREAIESAVVFVEACIEDDDSDSTQGAGRATLRRLAEAVGKACPKLLYEKREGQKLYGLRYRELAQENEQLKITLQRWIEWARMHGNDEHAHGLIVDSARWISSENRELSQPKPE